MCFFNVCCIFDSWIRSHTLVVFLELTLTRTQGAWGGGPGGWGMGSPAPTTKTTHKRKKEKHVQTLLLFCALIFIQVAKTKASLIFTGSLMGRDQWGEVKETSEWAWIIIIHLLPAASLLRLSKVEVMFKAGIQPENRRWNLDAGQEKKNALLAQGFFRPKCNYRRLFLPLRDEGRKLGFCLFFVSVCNQSALWTEFMSFVR